MRNTHYSCAALAALRIPGAPTSEAGWLKRVKRQAWPYVEVPAKGGKKGIRRDYAPPPSVAEQIKQAEGPSFTAKELAEMRLPGLPTTERAWLDRCQREGWDFVEVPGRGRGGRRRQFVPTQEMLELIRRNTPAALAAALSHADEPTEMAAPVTLTLAVSVDEAQAILGLLKELRRHA